MTPIDQIRAELAEYDATRNAGTTSAFNGEYTLLRSAIQHIRTLLAEVDRLTKNTGCARNQGSTQFCAEAVAIAQDRDAWRQCAEGLAKNLEEALGWNWLDESVPPPADISSECDAALKRFEEMKKTQ